MIVCEHSSLLTHVNGWVPIMVKWGGKSVFIQFFLEKRYGYRKKCLYLQAKSEMIADIHV